MPSDCAVVSECGNLKAHLENLAEQCRALPNPKWRNKLLAEIEVLEKMQTVLADFHRSTEMDIDLDLGRMQSALEVWNTLPDGIIASMSQPFCTLMSASPLLNELHRSRVLIHDLQKFSENERAFAKTMGARFRELKQCWSKLRQYLQNHPEDSIRYTTNAFLLRENLDLLQNVRRLGLFESFSLEHRHAEQAEYAAIETNQARRIAPTKSTRFRYTLHGRNNAHENLYTGNWLTAYVYQDIEKRLKLRGDTYELYSMVRYAYADAPLQIAGDIDLLLQVNGTIYFIECKSGKIDEERRRELARKALSLREMLVNNGIEASRFRFLLIHMPEVPNVATLFHGTLFQPKPMNELDTLFTDE